MRGFEIIVLVWLSLLTIPIVMIAGRRFLLHTAVAAICETCGNTGALIEDNKVKPCPDCRYGKQVSDHPHQPVAHD